MPRGRPRIRTPEYWKEYEHQRAQKRRVERWRRRFLQMKQERGCSVCDRNLVFQREVRERGMDPDFAICESCPYMIRQKETGD